MPTNVPNLNSPQTQDLLRAVFDFVLTGCSPLFWWCLARPELVEGASCFVIRTDAGLIGITADHVVAAFDQAKREEPHLICQFSDVRIDLEAAIIDREPLLDIATFRVSEAMLGAAGKTAIDCRGAWPPAPPVAGDSLSLVGFPQDIREVGPRLRALLRAWGALSIAESVTDREILFTFEPGRDLPAAELPLPDVGFNLSGCSGGPILLHKVERGILRFVPVGFMVGGPIRQEGDQSARGEAAAFDLIRGRLIHFVRADGTIERPDWLPPW